MYGHNGSGKSTLSELLLSLAEGDCATGIVWEDGDRRRTAVATGGAGPSPAMAVFTRRWVEENLAEFLEGAGASAIVSLGREAIDAKEEETRLVQEIEELHEGAREAAREQRAADRKVNEMARRVQDRIVSELEEFDFKHYTKNRYSLPIVQDRLRRYRGDIPDDNAHAEALKRLGESAPSAVPEIPEPPSGIFGALAGLAELLAETPVRTAIQALEDDPTAQRWVEQGIEMHDGLEHCLFCANEISNQRRLQLAQHFDESWLRIRGNANNLRDSVLSARERLVSWHSGLPSVELMDSESQMVYGSALDRAASAVQDRLAVMDAVERVLKAKADDPNVRPTAPDFSLLRGGPSTTVLAEAVLGHNDRAARHREVTEDRERTVLAHLIGSHSSGFRELEDQARRCAVKSRTSVESARLAELRLDKVRQSQFTTKAMADILTRDLARVYGKEHLSIAVTADGKSYACRRGDAPGKDLSEGERTTLSLLYFLRKLEDEQSAGDEPSRRIVVIDDPSSSLDRESLFATHQWLVDTLNKFGQYIVLTHDFSLLRLFIKSQRSQWTKSRRRIREGDVAERHFPRVSFMEMYATSLDGERKSWMGALPELLLNNTSEYAYLFEMVMAGVAASEDHERLFLLPNAARRVLEVFASYKVPDRPDFLRQLEALVESRQGEPFRDVYDFCNRFSHGEGNESVDVLDARAVQGQIRRCMEFLRAVDADHFERMCRATHTEATALPERT